MDGLFLRKNKSFIEKVTKRTEELSLIAKGDGTEVLVQKIQSGRLFIVSPGDNPELMEFFYILDGCISIDIGNESTLLESGDYFYTHNLKEEACFKANSEVTMLYVSTQPIFHMLSNEIKELTEISKMIEKKDMYTHMHNKRLYDYSQAMAERLHYSKEKVEGLLYAALYHDIGKINVPGEILIKPGKLTDEEFKYIIRHPSDGKILANKTYLRKAADIIEQHHERLDGSGYPLGLKGDQILPEAKIIAVIDSYDAMTTDRPYRKGFSPSVAMEEIKSLVDRYYDREIVNVFEQILKDEGIL